VPRHGLSHGRPSAELEPLTAPRPGGVGGTEARSSTCSRAVLESKCTLHVRYTYIICFLQYTYAIIIWWYAMDVIILNYSFVFVLSKVKVKLLFSYTEVWLPCQGLGNGTLNSTPTHPHPHCPIIGQQASRARHHRGPQSARSIMGLEPGSRRY